MIFSTATGYALRALSVLPTDGSYSLAKNIAEDLQLPGPYLAKILQGLAQADILESVRGPRGGFRLARTPDRITLGQVMGALEGQEAMEACLMGFPHCGPHNPCALHPLWSALRERISTELIEATVLDLQGLTEPHLATLMPGRQGTPA